MDNFIVSFSWEISKESAEAERVGAMYCFRLCTVNYN